LIDLGADRASEDHPMLQPAVSSQQSLPFLLLSMLFEQSHGLGTDQDGSPAGFGLDGHQRAGFAQSRIDPVAGLFLRLRILHQKLATNCDFTDLAAVLVFEDAAFVIPTSSCHGESSFL